MNFFSHGYQYVEQPYFLAGTAVPDLLNFIDRKIRARQKLAEAYVDDVDPHLAAVARGIVQHHEDDRRFHGTRVFTELSLKFAVELREEVPQDNGVRCGFVGHIVVELLLDAYLHERYPGLLDRYYQAFRSVDPLVVQATVNRITGKPTQKIATVIPRFIESRFLYDYGENDTLLKRINQVLHRIGLEPLPESVAIWIGSARRRVNEQAEALLMLA